MSVRHVWTRPTPYLGSFFGAWSLGVGDIDGDGYADVAMADATYSSSSTTSENGIVTVASGLTGAVIFTWVGVPFQRLGRVVQGVGDLNGDGRGDVAIQSRQPGGPATAVTVRSGADGTVLHTWTANDWYDWSFPDIVVAGDFDGDGVNDIGLAEPVPALTPGVYGPGVVRIYSGATGAVLTSWTGSAPLDAFGNQFACLCDLDGDAVPDFAIGAPGASPGGVFEAGRLVVKSGATGADIFVWEGSQQSQNVGRYVPDMGDVDGDGLRDVAIWYAYDVAWAGPLVKAVHSSATGAQLARFELWGGPTPSPYPQSYLGDVNRDGCPDYMGMFLSSGSVTWEYSIVTLLGLGPGCGAVGEGAPGTGGHRPRAATFGGSAVPGNARFGLAVSGGLGGVGAWLFSGVGVDPLGRSVLGCPVYLDLGQPVYWLSPMEQLGGAFMAPGKGYRVRLLPIPDVPALTGVTVHCQWVVADPGGVNGQFTTSNGLSITVQ